MEKWSFNQLFFSKLSDVLDISGAEIARRCNISQPLLNRYMNNENVLPVQVLIKICNSLRMPAYFFVSENSNDIIPERERATISVSNWHPIEWDTQAVELTFGDGEGRIFWKDVAEAMDVTPQKPHNRFLLRTSFKIDAFLLTCSRLNISPFKFLIDKNRESNNVIVNPNLSKGKGQSKKEKDLQAQVEALNKSIRSLSSTVADLTTKYKALMVRCGKLEMQLSEYAGTSIGMAAEEVTVKG